MNGPFRIDNRDGVPTGIGADFCDGLFSFIIPI